MLHYNRKFKSRAQDLRKNSTLGEILLWSQLKNKQLGFQFLRQKPILNYIVDFYCPELKLVIEIDGSSHDAKIEEDIFRQGQIESLGIVLLRFSETEVQKNLESIVNEIKNFTSPHSRFCE